MLNHLYPHLIIPSRTPPDRFDHSVREDSLKIVGFRMEDHLAQRPTDTVSADFRII